MKKLRLVALALVVLAAAAAHAQYRITPLPGSTPQTTCPFCFFPQPVAVEVQNPNGLPASGVPVTFSSGDFSVVFIVDEQPTFTVTTDAQGVALVSTPLSPSGYATLAPGTAHVVATAPDGTSTTLHLTAAGKAPRRIELLSGDAQVAATGGEMAPWVARAFDEDGNPVPNAVVDFAVFLSDGVPGAAFDDGRTDALTPAGADGIAISPRLIANSVAGSGGGGTVLLWVGDPDQTNPIVSTTFTLVAGDPNFGTLRPWIAPPSSVGVNATTAIPYSVKVLDASGQGVAGEPVTFATDRSCASFGAPHTAIVAAVTVNSDAQGIASSPALSGIHPKVTCATSAIAAGKMLDLTTHVFDPAKVAVAATPSNIRSHVNTGFSFVLTFKDHNLPVTVTDIAVRTTAPPNGPGLLTTPLISLTPGNAVLDVVPDAKTGPFTIQVTTPSGRVNVPVLQGP